MKLLWLQLVGMSIYFVGAITITYPGIAWFEKFHKPGRLLRALEELEASSISEGKTGFQELKHEINNIVESKYKMGKNIDKIDVGTKSINISGRVTPLKIKGYNKDSEKPEIWIKEPLFANIRYQIDRKIRRGKTKIRTIGIIFIVIGVGLQMFASIYPHLFSP